MSESAAKTTVPGDHVHPIVMQFLCAERKKPGLLWSLTHCTGGSETDSITVVETPNGAIATFPDIYVLYAWSRVHRKWWGYCPKGKEVVPIDIASLRDIFRAQYGILPVGGFLNPTVESDDGNDINFRCYYDNYDNEDDSWHYGYCRKTRRFYEA